MSNAIVYHENYNFRMPLRSMLHKFDGLKFERAYNQLTQTFGAEFKKHTLVPSSEACSEDIALAHSQEYLESLKKPSVIAKIVESLPLRIFSGDTLDKKLLQPMRYAIAGTLLAMEKVLAGDYDIIYNLGGGFHHAFRGHGEGFCVYNDLAIGIYKMQQLKLLNDSDRIGIVDLDAHFGNGNMSFFDNDSRMEFFDAFNFQAYAGDEGIKCMDTNKRKWIIPAARSTRYLDNLKELLPEFLDALKPRFVFYLAGTDVIKGDRLGKLELTQSEIFERDMLLIHETKSRNIPMVIVTAGGYTNISHELIAQTATALLRGN